MAGSLATAYLVSDGNLKIAEAACAAILSPAVGLWYGPDRLIQVLLLVLQVLQAPVDSG